MPTTQDGLPKPRRYLAIVAICFGTALVAIDSSIVAVALPTIASELSVEPSLAVALVTIYQLVLVMTVLPFSALGARIGMRRLYQYGQITFCIASVLCFFAKSLPFLLVTRAAQSIGGAAVLSVSSALIRSIYPSSQLGRGLAINNIIVSSSAALAPTLGGLILGVASWPWIFAVTVPFGIVSILIGRRALPEPPLSNEPYDVTAALLCALTFGLVIGGLESAVHGDSPVISLAIIAAGVVIGTVFVRRELGEKEPILPVDLLNQPIIGLAVIGSVLAFVSSMIVLLSMPFRLEQAFGFSPGEVGAVISPWPLGMMALGPLAGILSDRIHAGLLGGVGMTVATTGLLLLGFLPNDATHFDIAWRMALSGAGFGLFLAPVARLVVGASPRHRVASAGGMISTTRLTGQACGATVVSALLATSVGTGREPALLAALLAFLAGICSVAVLRAAHYATRPERQTCSANADARMPDMRQPTNVRRNARSCFSCDLLLEPVLQSPFGRLHRITRFARSLFTRDAMAACLVRVQDRGQMRPRLCLAGMRFFDLAIAEIDDQLHGTPLMTA